MLCRTVKGSLSQVERRRRAHNVGAGSSAVRVVRDLSVSVRAGNTL